MITNQTKPRYKLIISEVTKLHFLIPALTVPIPVDEIIKKYCNTTGYEFYSKGDDMNDEFSGQFFVKNNIFGILFNSNHHIHRQRFTICHEFGHFVLGHGVNLQNKQDIINLESNQPEELEANIFASYFLLPTNLLKPEVKDSTDYNLKNLGDKYNVSPEVIRLRLLHDSDLIGYKEDYIDRVRNQNTVIDLSEEFGSKEIF